MRKVLAFVAVSLLASSAWAITDEGPNSLGVYFDDGTFEVNCYEPTANLPHFMYFVVASPETPSNTIAGFEFFWDWDPAPALAPFLLAVTLPPGSLNVGDNQNLIVGFGSAPLPNLPATLIVSAQLLWVVVPAVQTYVTVGPATPATIPGRCAIADGADAGFLVPLDFSTVDGVDVVVDGDGFVRPGIGSIGCPAPIATETKTWGSVKSLY